MSNENADDTCLDVKENDFRLTDEEAKGIIEKISKCKNTTEFQGLDVLKRDKYLKLCRDEGISVRQLSRLTGVSFNVVRKF